MSTDNMKQPQYLNRLARHGGQLQRRKTIGSRLFLAVMGGVVSGLGIMAWFSYKNLESRALQQARATLNGEVAVLDGQLQSGESFLKSLSAATASIHNSGSGSAEAYRQLVQMFMHARPDLITGFGILQTPNGLVNGQTWFAPYIEESVAGRGKPLPGNPKFSFVDLYEADRYPTQDYYKTPLAHQNLAWTKPYLVEGYPIPLTTLAGPIKDAQGKTIAVLNGDVSLLDLQKIAKRNVYEGSGYFVALTAEGQILAYPANPKQAKSTGFAHNNPVKILANAKDVSSLKLIWKTAQTQLAQGKTAGSVTLPGMGSYWFYQQVPSTKWLLLAEVPINSITSSALAASLTSTILAGAIIAIVVALFVRSLNRRLQPILAECNRLAGSDANAYLNHGDEIEQLSTAFFSLVDEQQRLALLQAADVHRAEILRNFAINLSQAVSVEAISYTTVYNFQQALRASRVLLYQLQPDHTGEIIQQISTQPWPPVQGQDANLLFSVEDGLQMYQNQQIRVVEDIETELLTEEARSQATALHIQASLTVPLMVNNQLWGLLMLHYCEAPRTWEQVELDLLTQMAAQVGLSLERSLLMEQTEQVAQERLKDQETLQTELLKLIDSIEGAAMGDLTVRADVAGGMGTVADFFNTIVESLRAIVIQVKTSAEQVNHSVASNEVVIRQLADEALRQVSEVNQTLDSIQTMTMAMQTVAQNAQQAAQVAREASTTARAGEVAMDASVSNILGLRGTIAETSKKVKRLGESSQQISKAVVLINQLATKTKLLAINASIEAALAGESGQGFAVVAEEVGQLAAQSASATQDIAKIVDMIQQEVGDVVQAMEEGTLQVVEGTKLVEETRESLGQVLEVSRQIDALVASISTATVAQAETSATVTQLMQQIASVSEHTADTSQQVSDALQETVSVAEELQASVGTFKI